MPTCSVKWCGNSSGQVGLSNGISYHRFPRYPDLKEKWMNACQRGDKWFPQPNSVICSKHFTQDCFDNSKARRMLFGSAVPTQFLPILVSPDPLAIVKKEPPEQPKQTPDLNQIAPKPQNYVIMLLPSAVNVSPHPLPIVKELPGQSTQKSDLNVVATNSQKIAIPLFLSATNVSPDPLAIVKKEPPEQSNNNSNLNVDTRNSQINFIPLNSSIKNVSPNPVTIVKEIPAQSNNKSDLNEDTTDSREIVIPLYSSAEKTTKMLDDLPNELLTIRERQMKRHIEHLLFALKKKKKDVKRLQDKARKQNVKIKKLECIAKTIKNKSTLKNKNTIKNKGKSTDDDDGDENGSECSEDSES